MEKNGDEINLRKLINIGKDRGYITYQELNENLSDKIISSEEIDDLLQMFEDLNIKVVREHPDERPADTNNQQTRVYYVKKEFFKDNTLEGLKKIRKRLLDLTPRNRLLNFRHSKRSSLRVVNELPDELFKRLMDHQSFIFKPVPEPKPEEYKKESDNSATNVVVATGLLFNTDELKKSTLNGYPDGKKPTAKEYAGKLGISTEYELPIPGPKKNIPLKYVDKYIQTLHYPSELEIILRRISSTARTAIEESGTNMLYLAFGFLEWFESDSSSQKYLAPLLLMPVSITRGKKPNSKTGTFEYIMEYSGEDIASNLSLMEKLKLDFSLDLPELEEEDTSEAYLSKCRGILESKPNWRLRRYVTLGLFYFGKLLMYRDLNPNNWPSGKSFLDHSIIKDLFEGTRLEGPEFSEVYPLDSSEIENEVPLIIFDADSSQHSALIDALKGKNLVIEGPPGTGKSQTITNLIAAALVQDKTVLFVSEKLAALEVVRRRLDEAGLGIFCLELHSHKTKKKELLEDLERRITAKGHFKDSQVLDEKLNLQKKYKQELIDYLELINQKFGSVDKRVFEVFYARNRYREEFGFDPVLVNSIFLKNSEKTSLSDVYEKITNLEIYSAHLRTVLNEENDLTRHPCYGITNTGLDFLGEQELAEKLFDMKKLSKEMVTALSEFSSLTGTPTENTPKFIENLVALSNSLPQVSGNELYPLLPNFVDHQAIKIVFSFIKSLSEWQDASSILEQYFESTPSVDSELLTSAEKAWSQAKIYNLTSFGIQELKIALEEFKDIKSHIEKQREVFEKLVSEFGCNISYASISTEFLIKAILILNRTPPEILPLRQKILEDEAAFLYFKKAQEEFETLLRMKENLAKKFDLNDPPSPAKLKSHAAALSETGFVLRIFSTPYKEAKRVFLRLQKVKERVERQKMADSIKELASYFELLDDFNSNERYKTLLGIHFNGLDTPFKDLARLLNWYKAVRKELPLQQPSAGALARALMDFHSERLANIKDIIQKEKNSVQELFSLYKKLPQLHQKLPRFIKSKAQSNFDDFLTDLNMMIEEVEGIITILLDLQLKPEIPLNNILDLLNRLESQEKKCVELNETEEVQAILGNYFSGANTKIVNLEATVHLAETIHSSDLPTGLKEWLFDPNIPERLREIQKRLQELGELLEEFTSTSSEVKDLSNMDWNLWYYRSNTDPLNPDLATLADRIDLALAPLQSLSDWLSFLRSREKVKQAGLAPLARLAEKGALPVDDLQSAYQYVFYNSLARQIQKDNPSLMEYNGLTLDKIRKHFIQNDLEIIELYRERAAYTIDQRGLPPGNATGPVGHWTNLPLIKKEIKKQKRHIPIRQLINRAGEALQALKPCFMMGPLSVAQYLAPGRLKFDLLIMDEASQLKPEDALGAIVRSSQVVIVGDPKQLPPTSFFDRVLGEEEDEDYEDSFAIQEEESILDMASLLYQPIRQLNWHYRSRHGSLIAFSNREFYANRLIVFPSAVAESPSLGVKFKYVEDGIYEGRYNSIEAEHVVDAVIEHMRDNPRESLCVVTLNSTQRELIEGILDDRIKNDPFAQKFIEARQKGGEPFFVKNLENVQGDERDVIFISITFGRDRNGRLYHRFGPINNRANGHRRLNVLFTRAKRRTVVFSSMDPDEIHCESDSPWGLRALKGYLTYAKTGILKQPEKSGGPPANDFEISVGNALKERGFDIVPQVGVAGFFIDIAILHPEKAGAYILGVECDGATYHSSRSARDRDRLRQSVLKNLGWNIHRIWSTDWFKNSQSEIDRVVARIMEQLKYEEIRDQGRYEVRVEEAPTEEVRAEEPAVDYIAEKLFLSVEEARKQLIDLRENVIKREFPDLAPERGLLRKNMIDFLLEKRPTNRKEWLACIPLSLRENTDGRQMKYIDQVFEILESVAD